MIAARPDLLVIGGLTIDRFADGSAAPGGSVLHIARAAASRGVRVAILTVAGPEPEAQAALAELRQLVVDVEAGDADATATFSHHDTAQGRRLALERRGGRVAIAGSALLASADAVLVAPVAGEVSAAELTTLVSVPVRAAIAGQVGKLSIPSAAYGHVGVNLSDTPDGEQFVAVACGGNFQLSYPLGDAIIVFGLPKQWTP